MSHTNRVTCTNESWTSVFAGEGAVQIQLDDTDPVRIHVGGSAPASGAPGIVLSRGGLEDYINGSVETGDTVYIKAIGNDSAVVLIGTGTSI